MTNDLIKLACERAANRFGGSDGLFNAAGFGIALCELAGVSGSLDGNVVRAILTGRRDVQILAGSHYRFLRSYGRAP